MVKHTFKFKLQSSINRLGVVGYLVDLRTQGVLLLRQPTNSPRRTPSLSGIENVGRLLTQLVTCVEQWRRKWGGSRGWSPPPLVGEHCLALA